MNFNVRWKLKSPRAVIIIQTVAEGSVMPKGAEEIEGNEARYASVFLSTLALCLRDLSKSVKNTRITSTFNLKCSSLVGMGSKNFNDFQKYNAET